MTALYNEIDPFAAAWLRELIKAGHIAPGDVAECSIEDLTPNDLRGYTQCHFFAGIGVWSFALRSAGWPDSREIWTMSCPCQSFSAAGKGAGFADERHLWPAAHHLIRECRPPVVFGEQVASKGGLGWLDLVQADLEGSHYAAGAVDLCAAGIGAPHIRQRLWFVAENQLADTARGRGRAGLCDSGPAEQWWRVTSDGRSDDRMADDDREGRSQHPQHDGEPIAGCEASELWHDDAGRSGHGVVADTSHGQLQEPGRRPQERDGYGPDRPDYTGSAWGPGPTNGHWRDADWLFCRDGKWRPVEPGTFPLAHGAPARVGRLRGYGNAIVAQAAQAVVEAYLDIDTIDLAADRHLRLTEVSRMTTDNAVREDIFS